MSRRNGRMHDAAVSVCTTKPDGEKFVQAPVTVLMADADVFAPEVYTATVETRARNNWSFWSLGQPVKYYY